VAITVNFAASLPGATRALLTGRIHSRVPATILIAIGAFVASSGDTLLRFGVTDFFQVGKLLAVVFLFLGFLVSVEAFAEFRVPFTRLVLARRRRDDPAPPARGRPTTRG
jgi:predicted HD phosphohydrolase